ncbi:MAG: D-glycero-beta-D-manno-heptose-7-phosphate kinase [Vicinamibacteria bacterium]|nr:D-glycero-beta-D-manno-heptose-7-phosphate kinase [Vicinamibacteria bacterium]
MKTPLDAKRIEAILHSLRGGRVVVVGDVMLDVFVFGEVTRISPEAPVPVVRVTEETERLGGAANVALNVKSLGGRAALVGVVGGDLARDHLAKVARARGVEARLVALAGRATTVKTRIMAHQHQMVRTDREATEPIDAAVEAKLLAQVGKVLTRGSALIVSDYQKGVVTRSFMRSLIALARRRGARVLVDPKVRNIGLFRGAFLVTPNQKEAEEISGMAIHTDADAERAVHRIARIAGTEGALVTRGEEGMSLGLKVSGKFSYWHVRATAREVFDVTGAGDTAIATLALALVAGALPHEAMMLSNLAAGVAVGKLGTSSVTPAEIRAAQ